MIPNHTCAVFSGGGTRGIAFAGALDRLRKEGIDWGLRCPALETVAGCSIGALVALLISLGFSAHELVEFVLSTSFDQLVNLEPMQMLRVATSGGLGLDTGAVLQEFIAKQISRKTTLDVSSSKALTFEKLFDKTKCELVVVATNLNEKILQVFSSKTTPCVRVVDAVRASMALPPVFEPVEIDGKLFCDGGLLDNFPIDLFDADKVIGFRLASTTKSMQEVKNSAFPLLPFFHTVMKLSAAAADASAWFAIDRSVRESRVINIPCGTVSTFEHDVQNVKETLVKAGSKSAELFLQGKQEETDDIKEWKLCLTSKLYARVAK